MEELRDYITSYPDYPQKGIVFRDILPILHEPAIFKKLIINMSSNKIIQNAEAILAIDARGFIFGTAIANNLMKPLLTARKPGKLPGEIIEESYELEYGKSKLCVQKNSLERFKSYAIVDDLLATGGTVNCAKRIVEKSNKAITGVVVVVELKSLGAREKINLPVSSQIKY